MLVPTCASSHTDTTPEMPSVAMNANARVTPPNCASTPQMLVTSRRSSPSAGPVTTA